MQDTTQLTLLVTATTAIALTLLTGLLSLSERMIVHADEALNAAIVSPSCETPTEEKTQ